MEPANPYISVQILQFDHTSSNDLISIHDDDIVSIEMNMENSWQRVQTLKTLGNLKKKNGMMTY